MKKFFTLLTMLAIIGVANAQKERLLIDYFTVSNRDDFTNASQMRNQVITGIQSTNRLICIDVDSEKTLVIEESRRYSESAMGDQTARIGEMKRLGANYVLSGNVDNITTEQHTSSYDNSIYYTAEITFTLKITKTEDGSLLGSESIRVSGGGLLSSRATTREKALSNTNSAIKTRMKRFVDVYFPLEGTIAEIKEEKKGKMISCYISLGSDHGIDNGQLLNVFRIQQIAGRASRIEIGKLKVETVVAGDLSDCKVSKGGDVILKAFASGDPIVVETAARKPVVVL